MEKNIKIDLFQNWLCENVEPCNWNNSKRYNNYLAKIVMNEKGEEARTFMPISNESDLYFNVRDLTPKDIVVASCWDRYKGRQYKHYYIVVNKTDDSIMLEGERDGVDYTTYLKTFKSLQKNNDSYGNV